MTSVSIAKCDSYNIENVQNAVDNCLDNLGGLSSFIKPGNKVLIKPNILLAKAPEEAITTHPAVIEAIITAVKKVGAIPLIGDSPGGLVGNVGKHWKITGIEEVCKRLDVEILNFEALGVYKKTINGNHYHIAKPVLEADIIINVPKIKTHGLTTLTCAIKNMYGVIPGLTKVNYHKEAPKPSDFSGLVVDIFALSKPQLNIVDGIIGMDGSGPSAGNPKELGMILASSDAVALDSLICHILGKDPLKVSTNKIAHERGLGEANINKIDVLGYQPSVRDDFKWPPSIAGSLDMVPSFISKGLMRFWWTRPAIDSEICTKCNKCVKSCPVEALSFGASIPEFNYPECINCMCCMEMCPEKAVHLEKSLLSRLLSRESN
jgi:uncharacterized protein (DUF362 family)/NAD-dependent dihydropyrimidine dehydrogenase PreA subunit